MPEDLRSTTPTTPLKAMAHRWWLAAALVVVCGGAGAAVAGTRPVTYTGEARVAVGSQSLDARLVAGYSLASTQLAADVARYVNDAQAQASIAPALGASADEVSLVSASPIADSSVVRIEVQASTQDAAVRGAQAVADQLTTEVNSSTGETSDSLLQQYTTLSQQVAVAQQALSDAQGNLASLTAGKKDQADIDAARSTVEQAAAALDVLEVRQTALSARYRNSVTNTPAAAGLRVVQPGQASYDDASSTQQKFGLAGAVLGFLIALLAAVGLDRRRVRAGQRDVEPQRIDIDDAPAGGAPRARRTEEQAQQS